jgi:hypothetical protein
MHDISALQCLKKSHVKHGGKRRDLVSQAPSVGEISLVKGRYESLVTFEKALLNLDVRLSSVLVIVHTTMSYNADMKYSST